MGKLTSSGASSENRKRGLWTHEEDQKLFAYIQRHGLQGNSWQSLPLKAGLQRCGKSCRLRWKNYLRPDIKRGNFSLVEDQTIIRLHALLGNRWSAIAAHLPMRTDNEIKNYWNIHLKKRLAKLGVDPVTHKPKAAANVLASADGGDPKNLLTLSHMAQWESARLQAEARFVSDSNKSIHQHDINAINPADLTSDLEYYYSKPADHHKPAWTTHNDQLLDFGKLSTGFTGIEFAAPPHCLHLQRVWESLLMSKSVAPAVGGKDGGVGGATNCNVAQDHFVSFCNVNVGVSSCGFEPPPLISAASVSSMVDISDDHLLIGQSGNEYYCNQYYY